MLVLAVAALARPAAAASVSAGRAIFSRCAICHNIAAGAGTKVGPDLHGIFGRKAGTWDDFEYSAALRHSGIVWNDKTLAEFVKDPRRFIPGNRMAFPGIDDDREIADLLAYLHHAAQ
jgi:cytochrome c